jgi:hypothetical protein
LKPHICRQEGWGMIACGTGVVGRNGITNIVQALREYVVELLSDKIPKIFFDIGRFF